MNTSDKVKGFDNVRRMAERGLMRAQQPPMQSAFIDMFQHILDEYDREAKAIRNAAIDEAIKVAEGLAEGELRDTAFAAYDDVANKIKELKE